MSAEKNPRTEWTPSICTMSSTSSCSDISIDDIQTRSQPGVFCVWSFWKVIVFLFLISWFEWCVLLFRMFENKANTLLSAIRFVENDWRTKCLPNCIYSTNESKLVCKDRCRFFSLFVFWIFRCCCCCTPCVCVGWVFFSFSYCEKNKTHENLHRFLLFCFISLKSIHTFCIVHIVRSMCECIWFETT